MSHAAVHTGSSSVLVFRNKVQHKLTVNSKTGCRKLTWQKKHYRSAWPVSICFSSPASGAAGQLKQWQPEPVTCSATFPHQFIHVCFIQTKYNVKSTAHIYWHLTALRSTLKRGRKENQPGFPCCKRLQRGYRTEHPGKCSESWKVGKVFL